MQSGGGELGAARVLILSQTALSGYFRGINKPNGIIFNVIPLKR